MNEQRIEGAVDEFKGGVKQAAGNLTGDQSLRADGAVDRVTGAAKQAIGSARDAIAPALDSAREAAAPVVEKARSLTREKPWAVAALLGVVGMAIIGTLRGRGVQVDEAKPAPRRAPRKKT